MSERPTEQKLISYILGELSPDEQLQLETEYFSEPAKFEQLQALKDQLIDQYANNQLSAKQRKLFEQQFLDSPWRRERIVFAQALTDHLAAVQPAPATSGSATSWWQSFKNFFNFPELSARNGLALAMMLLLMISAGWLWFDNNRLRSQVAQLNAQQSQQQASQSQLDQVNQQVNQQRNRIKELEQQLTQAAPLATPAPIPTEPTIKKTVPTIPETPAPAIFSFILNAAAVRGSDGLQKLTIPAKAEQIMLIINLKADNPAQTVKATLTTVEGDLVWQSQLKPIVKNNSQSIRIKLKASMLPENDYDLTLTEVNRDPANAAKLGEYAFRIIKTDQSQ